MKIAIVGAGYVGLVTGVSLAKLGHQVLCIDKIRDKISTVNQGKSPFFEKGLDPLLKAVTKKGLFEATDKFQESILKSDITIIAVGTPTINGKIDLSAIKKAAEQIGKALQEVNKYHVVTVKSTVLPGVTEKFVAPILEKYSQKRIGEFGLCMNPEFLREGTALEDALHPDRIVIGQYDDKSGKEFAKIYSKVLSPKIFTNLWTAEMIKYAANGLLATLISYSNEIARISQATGKIDAADVWKGVHLDKRLSPLIGNTRIKPGILNYILSGCGFGGSCLPKDTKALIAFADELGVDASLIKSAIEINRTQPHQVLLLLKDVLGENLKEKKIAVLGLTFKPDTDDIRESSALPIIEELLSQGAKVAAHDPKADKKNVFKQLTNPSFVLAETASEAIRNADAAIVVTAWKEYSKLPAEFFKKYMKRPVVIDGRRIYDKLSFLKTGVIYKGIGL